MAANTGQSPSFAILNRLNSSHAPTQTQPQTYPSRPLAVISDRVNLSEGRRYNPLSSPLSFRM